MYIIIICACLCLCVYIPDRLVICVRVFMPGGLESECVMMKFCSVICTCLLTILPCFMSVTSVVE